MEARIWSRKTVKPAVPTPDHLRTCTLSIFDQLAPPAHVPFVYFYNSTSPVEGKLEQLVISLSQTLTRFYPLAGRFIKEGFYIDCNDEGVKYIEAEHSDIELSDFLKIAEKNLQLVTDLVPWEVIGETLSATTPIVGIKVTIFKCGGIAIAQLVSHMVVDGFTAAKFIHDWSTTTANTLLGNINHAVTPILKPATFGVSSYFPARDLSLDIKNMPIPMSKFKKSKIVTRRFVFDEKSISTLKAKVVESANITRPTRIEVVTSIIWKALINISSNNRSNERRNSTLYLHMNLRGRTCIAETAPPLATSCGNFYLEVPTRYNNVAEINSGLELHELVSLLRDSLRYSVKNCSNISSTDGLFTEVAKYANAVREDKGNEDVDVWLLSTLCRFPFYEVDFGWGKPEWVSTGGIPDEVMFLLDTKCGTGIEAVLNLHEIDMLQLEQDPDIVAFTS